MPSSWLTIWQPCQYVSYRPRCFSWEKYFISWFSYEYKLFLKDLYSTHSSQEFCITWMLLIYFHILNCCLFKQIITNVHVVNLDKLFKAQVLSQYCVWKIIVTVTEIICNCLSLCMHFWIKCCWVTAWGTTSKCCTFP